MKKLLLALAAAATLPAQALTTGDIAFTSFNADEDGLSFVTFVDLAANTSIYFSDNEWNGSAIGAGGAFNTGESYNQWVSGPSIVTAGTVVRLLAYDKTTLSASFGTLSRQTVSGNSNWGISNSNETVYAYVGTSATAPTTFLAAITNSSFSVADGQLAGTGLTEGTSNAIRLTAKAGASNEPDFAQYTGSRGTFTNVAAAKTAIGDLSNWTIDTVNNSVSASIVPNTTAFTIAAPVPEPETYALVFAGLATMGMVARRRRNV